MYNYNVSGDHNNDIRDHKEVLFQLRVGSHSLAIYTRIINPVVEFES